jgi:hypothetical protein
MNLTWLDLMAYMRGGGLNVYVFSDQTSASSVQVVYPEGCCVLEILTMVIRAHAVSLTIKSLLSFLVHTAHLKTFNLGWFFFEALVVYDLCCGNSEFESLLPEC